jgi:hypothetical protein
MNTIHITPSTFFKAQPDRCQRETNALTTRHFPRLPARRINRLRQHILSSTQ